MAAITSQLLEDLVGRHNEHLSVCYLDCFVMFGLIKNNAMFSSVGLVKTSVSNEGRRLRELHLGASVSSEQ